METLLRHQAFVSGLLVQADQGPSGTSRILSFAGQSLCLGDFQATSWGECLGGG